MEGNGIIEKGIRKADGEERKKKNKQTGGGINQKLYLEIQNLALNMNKTSMMDEGKEGEYR